MEWILVITVWYGSAPTIYTMEQPIFKTEIECKASAPYAMRAFMGALAAGRLGTPNGSIRGSAPHYDVTCEVKGSKEI
jgi:hypothetical protein